MATYILRRLLTLIPVLLLVSIMTFMLVHLTPGDPVSQLLGDDATGAEIEAVRDRLGLNEPLYEQYFTWLFNVIQGDLGQSLFADEPVAGMILSRVEPTLFLTFMALLFTLVIGLPAGVFSAIKHNSAIDQSLMIVALLGVSMPNFWLGLNLILLFSVYLGWFPVGGYTPISESLFGAIESLILPAFALGFSQAALVARITRSSMLEVLRNDYVRTARAKGLGNRVVYYRHALKNALLPTVTVIGVVVAVLIGGAVVTETVFTLPGAGRLVVNSVLRRDYPVVQGAILIVALLYVLINLLVDILYVYIDPRVKYT